MRADILLQIEKLQAIIADSGRSNFCKSMAERTIKSLEKDLDVLDEFDYIRTIQQMRLEHGLTQLQS